MSIAWFSAVGLTVICLITIVLLISRSYSTPPTTRSDQTMVTSPEESTAYKQSIAEYAAIAELPEPVFIPTGLHVQSIEFSSAYDIRATGYIWARYPASWPDSWAKGVVFPEAERQDFTLAYRRQQGDEELIGWYFVVNIRQYFDYQRYPFDRQDIWFRIWHADFEANTGLMAGRQLPIFIFVPDFESYSTNLPADKFGVEPFMVLEGWDIQESFFSYNAEYYSTNFGFTDLPHQSIVPVLIFNVGIKRNVVTPLLTQGVSPVVIIILVFVTFLFFSVDQQRRGSFGLSWNGTISLLSGSFFATLVAQAGLRNQIRSDGFVYLESLHILIYPMILGVAIMTTLMVVAPDNRVLGYHDNIVPKLLYWPLIGLTMLLVSYHLF